MAGRRIREIAIMGDTAMAAAPLRGNIVSDARLPHSRRGYDTMALALATGGWTVEMVHALPKDGIRCEVIDGDLYVSPSAT